MNWRRINPALGLFNRNVDCSFHRKAAEKDLHTLVFLQGMPVAMPVTPAPCSCWHPHAAAE